MLSQALINTFKNVRRKFETQLKMMVAAKWWLCSQYRNKLFSGKQGCGSGCFQPLPLPHLLLPLSLTKNKKTTVDNFLTFMGL